MHKKSKIMLIVFSFFSLPVVTHAGWFWPSDYDECILSSMKGVTSNTAASYISDSCREKFPVKQYIESSSKETNIMKTCEIYWNGWEFKLGKPNDNDFKGFAIHQYGLETIRFYLPKKMLSFLKVKNDFEDVEKSEEFSNFFNSQEFKIMDICTQKK